MSEKIKLQKLLSNEGVASRRKVEEYIKAGKVSVNGEIAHIGCRVSYDDEITLFGKRLILKDKERVYLAFNKPAGVVCTMSDEKGRRCISDVVHTDTRIFPVGRLDYNTQGLLILTNDGDLAHSLMHPSHNVEKEYEVVISIPAKSSMEYISDELSQPIEIDGRFTKRAFVKWKSLDDGRYLLNITINEGRNRQIRRICERSGVKIISLTRIREGNVMLGNLKPGKIRRLSDNELNSLRKL